MSGEKKTPTSGAADFWSALRVGTPARIGIGRAGSAQTTVSVLDAGASHAAARDAVHTPLDVEAVVADLAGLGLGTPIVVASRAKDRSTYLTRPDLGRTLGSELEPPADGAESALVIVVADGLSATAVQEHAANLIRSLLAVLPAPITVGLPVVATQARVALGDHIGAALKAQLVLVLIGERPGLSSSDSLGAYLTWAPQLGVLDSARNCVSNIRPPHGLDYDTAARTIASLIAGARELGVTGVRLKDVSGQISA